MTTRTVRAGPWRNRVAFGVVLVALTGCADSCGPNRANTDDAVLVEFPDAQHATVTVTGNRDGSFRFAPEPQGAAAATATSAATAPEPPATLPQDPKVIDEAFAQALRPHPVTADVPHPRLAMARIARLLDSDARVDSVAVTPGNHIVGRITIPDGVADPLAVRPAALAAALGTTGDVWVGMCRQWGEGRWTRADHAYDLGPGCAGWVPQDRTVPSGTLTSADTHSPLQAPTIWLGLATVALATVTIAGIAIRRRWWHSLVALAVVIGTFVAAGRLLVVQWDSSRLADTFGTTLDAGIHDDAGRLLGWAAFLVVAGMVAAFWLALPAVQRRRERRHRMYAVEPFDAGLGV